MKKKIIIPVLLALIAIIWVFSYKQYLKNEEKKKQYQTLPDFTFYSLGNDTIEKASLKKDMFTVLIFFNSQCDYCLLELGAIEKDIEKLKDIQLALISSEPADSLRKFKKQYDFSPVPDIEMYYARMDHLVEKFTKYSVPSVFIYDTEDRLVEHFKGFTKIDEILEVISPLENED